MADSEQSDRFRLIYIKIRMNELKAERDSLMEERAKLMAKKPVATKKK